MSIDYQDFELEIAEGDGQTYPVRVNTPVGPGQAILHFPYSEQELENRLLKLENVLLTSGGTLRRSLTVDDQQVVQSFGAQLFEMLFAGEVGTLYDASKRTTRQAERGLRIKLRIQSPKLAALPWEFLYDKQSGDYICLSRHMPLIRYLDLDPIQPLPVQPPLQILGMVVSPSDLTPLDMAKEKQHVERALATLQQTGHVKLTWLEGQTWRELQNALQQGPCHIFHFIGHGRFSADQDKGQVAFADEVGRAAFFDTDDLGRMLGDHFPLRLVFLNSCEGARSSADHLFSSTAAALVRRGTPAVLAMQYPISDNAAIQFSETFYSSLAHGLPVDSAVSEARKAIGFNRAGSYEWAIPVLTMRVEDGRIFEMPIHADTVPMPPPNPWWTREPRLYGAVFVTAIVALVLFFYPWQPTSSLAPGGSNTVVTSTEPDTPTPSNGRVTDTITRISLPEISYVTIPAGEITMGNSEADVSSILQKCDEALGPDYCNRKQYADEVPQNKVFVDEFRIMDTELTNGQYKQCVDEGKCAPPDNAYWADPTWVNRPVTDVDWDQANAYAKWANGRLPTEAEWEKACRAADGDLYPWGSDDATLDLANFKPDKQASASLEGNKDVKYSSGAHGLYDMAGNVYEWTSSLDWTYPYKDSDGREDPKATGNRIVRGGSYAHDRFDARCANRLGYVASGENARVGSIGFRLVSNQPAE